jgi:hypothetical protein
MSVSNLDLGRARAAHVDCPSELQLDRWHAGELDESGGRQVKTHIEGCQTCGERMALRRDGFAAFGLHGTSLLAPIRARVKRPASVLDRLRAWLSSPGIPIGLAAATAALVFVIVPTNEVRTKGQLGLRVYRERGGDVQEVTSTDHFFENDRIRFRISGPGPNPDGHIMIIGVEDSKKSFVYYPTGGATRSAKPTADEAGVLSGAIRLDDYTGDEWLHLVRCTSAFERADLGDLPPSAEAKVPDGCDHAAFRMRKVTP